MAFAYLILAHLVADFLLQPNALLQWKYHNWKGVAVHASIHLLAYILVFAPYIGNTAVIAVVTMIALSHFLIDVIKIRQEKRIGCHFKYFLVDQFAHFFTLFLGGHLLTGITAGNFYLVLGLILFICSTYAFEIVRFQLQRKSCAQGSFRPNYKAMALRGVVTIGIFSFIVILLLR